MRNLIFILTMLVMLSCECFGAHWTHNEVLNVYIEPNPREYIMEKAFRKWESVSRGIAKFEFVTKIEEADISVVFDDELGNSKAGVCTTQFQGNKIIKAKIQLSRKVNGYAVSNNEYYRTMLHEIGHALGLKHTNRLNSIMNPTTDYAQLITGKDIQDLEALYKE